MINVIFQQNEEKLLLSGGQYRNAFNWLFFNHLFSKHNNQMFRCENQQKSQKISRICFEISLVQVNPHRKQNHSSTFACKSSKEPNNRITLIIIIYHAIHSTEHFRYLCIFTWQKPHDMVYFVLVFVQNELNS